MQEKYFEARGIAYQVNEFQPGRETLVLIHGFSSSLSIWAPFMPLFTGSYNLLTYDLRGNGKSARPKTFEEYALSEHVEDLHALFKELEVRTAVVVGFSFGALVAMEFARLHSARVSKLVCISPVYGLRWRYFVHLTKNFLAYAARRIPDVHYSGERIVYERYRGSDRNVRLTFRQAYSTGLREYIWELQYIYGLRVDSHWSELSAPTTIVHGARDTIIPLRYAVLLKRRVRRARLVVIENGNHLLPINNVPEVAEAIRDAVENY